MGDKDKATIKLMRKNEVFADAFNYLIYGGKQVINPNDLNELDTREIAVIHDSKKKATKLIQRIRDVIKYAVAKTNEKTKYLILGIENQSNIHYSMPLRNILYDALRYTKQVEDKIASHKSSNDYKNVNSDEFLSGFRKDDHILPVITLVIYFGYQEWDAPLSIHEMLTEQDEAELALIPDYKVNLIAPYSIDDKDFDKFHSSLKEVLSFIKYAKDDDKLQE